MISGTVSDDGVPTVRLTVAGKYWTAIVDSGFNGDLELPSALRQHVNARFLHETISQLASNVSVVEELYLVDFPFDHQTIEAEATFVEGQEILIGTHLLQRHRLTINFVARTVRIQRVG
jgi:predicted aspartyl protease